MEAPPLLRRTGGIFAKRGKESRKQISGDSDGGGGRDGDAEGCCGDVVVCDGPKVGCNGLAKLECNKNHQRRIVARDFGELN